MAGAMRRMGVYLGLVEDDDTRGGYDRYAARQSDYDRDDRGYDRGYDRYAADDADPVAEESRYGYGSGYGGGYDTEYAGVRLADEPVEERAPEPEVSLGRRPATPRTIGLAGTPSSGSTAARLAGGGLSTAGSAGAGSAGRSRISAGGSGAATGLAMSEPVTPAPAPEPAPAPASAPAPQNYRIPTVHPASYNEARTIGERFRDGMPVIMNLADLDHADGRRLV
ncbi:cell division protein SepF, partial [Modestobacter marinus]|uniref:cell division protein SepF n=1 Tax=Modestobacter marinus TaxID=477641 RepID=UPI0024B765AA